MKLIDPIKSAYDRLYRKGLRFTRDQIRIAFEDLEMDGLNANSEQVDCVVQYLIEKENQITIAETGKVIVDFENPEVEKEDIIDSPLFRSEEEIIDEEVEINGGLILTQSQKISMIQNQSAVLGVQLDNQQIHTTASMMVSNYSSFEESIEEVKSLIIQVLTQQRNQAEEKLVESLNEIADAATAGFESLSERSSKGFDLIMGQLKTQETDFKSRTQSLKDELRKLIG